MAKYKQECIFGIRAVIEAIQQEKEIDKVMLKQGVRGRVVSAVVQFDPGTEYSFPVCAGRCF